MREDVYGREFGERLRQIRQAAGLTRVELGARIGATENHLWRLEDGRMKRPGLDLIARFLQACGARWSEVTDLLERVKAPSPDTQLVEKSSLTVYDRRRLTRAVTRQARKYAREMAYSPKGRPLESVKLEQTVSSFGRYRVIAGLVEHAVAELVRSNGVSGYERGKYKAFARHELGKLWRQAAAEAGERPGPGSRTRNPAAKAKLDDEFWAKQSLNPDLLRQVREVVTERFRQIAENQSPRETGAGNQPDQERREAKWQ